MKNKTINRLAIALMFLALVSVVVISCKKDDNASAVELFSFGPTPVLRGNEIKFIGQNLDQVTSVTLPPSIEITDINVVSASEIRVTVPQEAEVGHVVLNFDGGSITSKSMIGYSEPYEITSIAPTDKTIRAGDEVTINGDYLNNIVKVSFMTDASIDSADFVAQARKQIKVIVPKEASSGKIIVEDAAGNQLYSDQELTIAQPTIASFSATEIKAGQDLAIKGQNLDLVTKIEFQGGTSVDAAAFKSQNTDSITVTTPDNLQDGTVKLATFAGIDVISSQSLTTVMPSNVQIAAETQFKTGLNVTITGSDLDLATGITFTGGAEITDFTMADGKITLAIPDDALDGAVTLSTASGKTVATDAITLVKPVVTEVNPNPVSSGKDITITGTDLDLVKSVTFGGDVKVDVTPSSTSITVTVPLEAETGELVLTMASGATVNTPSLTVDKPEFCFIPTLPEGETDAGTILSVDVQNEDKLTDVQVNGASTQYILQGTTLYVLIPNDAGGTSDLKLISSNGDVTYQIQVKGSSTVETVVYQGPLALTWADGGRVMVPSSAFDGVAAGSVMKIYFTQTDNWGQAQINNGNWAPIPFAELGNDAYMTTDIYNDKSASEQELVLTQDVLDNIRNNAAWGNGLIIQGQDWIISKISIITSASSAETIWTGEQAMGNWAAWVQLPSDLFANAAVGKTLSLSVKDLDPSVTYWQVAVKNGADWSDIQLVNLASDATSQDITIDDNLLNIMKSNGLIISGYSYTLTKVEIK